MRSKKQSSGELSASAVMTIFGVPRRVIGFSFVLVLPCALIIACSLEFRTDERAEFQALEKQWLAKALAIPLKSDPRGDGDRLRPIVNYDTEVIEVSSTGGHSSGLLVGGGWQLIGSTIDTVSIEERSIVLIGLRAVFYRDGLWNNQVDVGKSFEAYVLVQREGTSSVMLSGQQLPSPPPENLLGLRMLPDAASLEVLHAGSKGTGTIERILLK